MRLLGILDKNNTEEFLIEDEGKIFTDKSQNNRFDNYELIKNRDRFIGNTDKKGKGVFNFRYGPVTAGVGQAGVFNIKTYGERILSVSIDPSYKKRNIEQLMINKTPEEALRLAESVCGNFAFSHSLAFSRAIENIYGFDADENTKRVRIIALELERIYNHIYVMARLSKGAAQNVLTSHLEWLFEESLRTNKLFSSERFLKNFNSIGAVNFSNSANIETVKDRIKILEEKFGELYQHSLKSWNFIDRIYKTATLTSKQVISIGLTGPSLRATGVGDDLRKNENLYENFKTVIRKTGDALARMEARAYETLHSCDIILTQLEKLKNGVAKPKKGAKDGAGIGYCESPSGIVAYYVELKNGLVDYVYISTPSVFGYKAFADSFVGYIFTDFSFALDSFGINFADCAR